MMAGHHSLDDLRTINANLRRYNETFMGPANFDFLVHLDTDRLYNVYRWRIQQERALRDASGTGMTDDHVVNFVKVYMPTYELYLDRLQAEAFLEPHKNTQLRVVLDEERKVTTVDLF